MCSFKFKIISISILLLLTCSCSKRVITFSDLEGCYRLPKGSLALRYGKVSEVMDHEIIIYLSEKNGEKSCSGYQIRGQCSYDDGTRLLMINENQRQRLSNAREWTSFELSYSRDGFFLGPLMMYAENRNTLILIEPIEAKYKWHSRFNNVYAVDSIRGARFQRVTFRHKAAERFRTMMNQTKYHHPLSRRRLMRDYVRYGR